MVSSVRCAGHWGAQQRCINLDLNLGWREVVEGFLEVIMSRLSPEDKEAYLAKEQ